MGAGSRVTAYDCVFNREVLGDTGQWFSDEAGVGSMVEQDEATGDDRGERARSRAAQVYRWEDVIDGYAALCERLAR